MCSQCGARLDMVDGICTVDGCGQCDVCCTCDPPLWQRMQHTEAYEHAERLVFV